MGASDSHRGGNGEGLRISLPSVRTLATSVREALKDHRTNKLTVLPFCWRPHSSRCGHIVSYSRKGESKGQTDSFLIPAKANAEIKLHSESWKDVTFL